MLKNNGKWLKHYLLCPSMSSPFILSVPVPSAPSSTVVKRWCFWSQGWESHVMLNHGRELLLSSTNTEEESWMVLSGLPSWLWPMWHNNWGCLTAGGAGGGNSSVREPGGPSDPSLQELCSRALFQPGNYAKHTSWCLDHNGYHTKHLQTFRLTQLR